MPATERTTIKETTARLVAVLRENLTAEPPTAARPFRRVVVGDAAAHDHPRPFLAVRLIRVRPLSAIDGDRVVEAAFELRLVTDVTAAEPHDTLLDRVAAVENVLDSLVDEGLIDGAAGLDDRAWNHEFPRTGSGSRVAAAAAVLTVVAAIEREAN